MAYGAKHRDFRFLDRRLRLATTAVLSLTGVINGDVYGQSSERGVQQELSFFEYLAEMVETEDRRMVMPDGMELNCGASSLSSRI